LRVPRSCNLLALSLEGRFQEDLELPFRAMWQAKCRLLGRGTLAFSAENPLAILPISYSAKRFQLNEA
jgi:hypothetical protein